MTQNAASAQKKIRCAQGAGVQQGTDLAVTVIKAVLAKTPVAGTGRVYSTMTMENHRKKETHSNCKCPSLSEKSHKMREEILYGKI